MKNKKSVLSNNFGAKLRQLRLNKGWSQAQLGNRIGIESNRVSRYERSTLWPTLELMVKIAEVFEVSVDYLIRDNKELAVNKIANKKLLKSIEEINELPQEYQNTLIIVLDAFVKKYRFEQLAKS